MTFQYKGIFNENVKKIVNESIKILSWNNPNLKCIILRRKCPKCENQLFYADLWYNIDKIVVFKRMCSKCRRIYILAGFFERNYKTVKNYFINKFRLEMLDYNNNRSFK